MIGGNLSLFFLAQPTPDPACVTPCCMLTEIKRSLQQNILKFSRIQAENHGDGKVRAHNNKWYPRSSSGNKLAASTQSFEGEAARES